MVLIMGISQSQIDTVENIIAKLQRQLSDAVEEFKTDMVDLKELETPNRKVYIGFMQHRTRMLQYYTEDANLKLKTIIESPKDEKDV